MPAHKRPKSSKLAKDSSPEVDDDDDDEEEMMEVEEPGTKHRKLTRAEKSKNAAKCRRDKESVEFANIINSLPFPNEELEKMDKSSIVKLTTSYFKMIDFIEKEMSSLTISEDVNAVDKEKAISKPSPNHVAKLSDGTTIKESQLMLEALGGFLMLLDRKRRVLFVSKNIEDQLGLSQVQMIGKPIEDFIEEKDIPELRKQFNLKFMPQSQRCDSYKADDIYHQLDEHRLFYLRMMCQFKNNKAKYKGHTLVQWSGRLKMRKTNKANNFATTGLVCVCKVMQTNSILEIKMDGNMFISRHDLGMTFTFCDPRIITLIGYEPSEVIGRTAYQFHNPLDAERVRTCHSNLIVKGTSVSKYYRFIGKNSDWVWMQTRASIIYNTNNVPQYIVCMNYIISEEEGVRVFMEEDKESLCCTGVMDINSKPVKHREKGDHHDHHSDSGYHSGYSPYSSINPSPLSESSFSHHDVSDDIPMSVVQECASSLDPDAADSDEMMKFIESLDGNDNDINKGYNHDNVQLNGNPSLAKRKTLQRIQSCPQVSSLLIIDDPEIDDQPIQFLCGSGATNHSSVSGNQFNSHNDITSNHFQIPKEGLVNIQIGSLNDGNVLSPPTLSEPLPKEISDFCMQYAESMADIQSQDIISQFAHDSLFPDLDGIGGQNGRINNHGGDFNNIGSPNSQNSYGSPQMFTNTQTVLNCQQVYPQQQVFVPTTHQNPMSPPTHMSMYPTSPPLYQRRSDTPNSYMSGSSVMSPPQSYSNLSSPMSMDSSQCGSSMSVDVRSPVPQQQFNQGGINHMTMNQIRSPPHTMPNGRVPASSQTMYTSNRVNGHADRSLLMKMNNRTGNNMSQSDVANRMVGNKVKTSHHKHCNGTTTQQMIASRLAPHLNGHQNSMPSSNSQHRQTVASPSSSKGLRNVKSMSELEKMLRGYSPPILNDLRQNNMPENGGTLLQQMLTGTLSGEKYIEMEKQRQKNCAMRVSQSPQ